MRFVRSMTSSHSATTTALERWTQGKQVSLVDAGMRELLAGLMHNRCENGGGLVLLQAPALGLATGEWYLSSTCST